MIETRKRAKVLSSAMQKGGVGKTTTTKNLGFNLSLFGKKVLLVDNDQNADTTDSCVSKLVVEESGQPTIYDVYMGRASINDVKIKVSENIDLVPSSVDLASVEVELSSMIAREFKLKKALEEVIYDYDYILIDCSPSLSISTINALVASDATIYIVQLEYFSMNAIRVLQKTVDIVLELNPSLEVLGLLLTMSDGTNHVKEVKEELEDTDYEVLGVISRSTTVRDAIMAKQAIGEFEPNHKTALEYKEFAENVLSKMEAV